MTPSGVIETAHRASVHPERSRGAVHSEHPHLEFAKLSVRFGDRLALDEISFAVPRHTICAVVGPANSGKSSLLKCINRTLDFEPRARVTGEVLLDGERVSKVADVLGLRRRVGMVFPLPVGLPMSVYDNVAWAPRSRGVKRRADLDVIVERALRQAVLWDEVARLCNQEQKFGDAVKLLDRLLKDFGTTPAAANARQFEARIRELAGG